MVVDYVADEDDAIAGESAVDVFAESQVGFQREWAM